MGCTELMHVELRIEEKQHRLYRNNNIVHVDTTKEQKVKHNIQCLYRVKRETESYQKFSQTNSCALAAIFANEIKESLF